MTKPSKGAEMLRACISPKFSQAEIASKLNVTKQAVYAWVNGLSQPTPAKLAELEDVTGIPMRAWTEAPEEDGAGDAA